MQLRLGYFDDEAIRVEPIENPFGSKVLPMSPDELSPMCPEWAGWSWLGALHDFRNWVIREAA